MKSRYTIGTVIFGLPGERAEDFVEAAHLYADARKLNRVKVHLLPYFPGTPILGVARRMGLADEEDERRAAEGEAGDFFHESSVRRGEAREHLRRWRNFYRVQPLLGGRLAHAFARRGWNRWIGRLPGAVIVLLQVLLARGGSTWQAADPRRLWKTVRAHFSRYLLVYLITGLALFNFMLVAAALTAFLLLPPLLVYAGLVSAHYAGQLARLDKQGKE